MKMILRYFVIAVFLFSCGGNKKDVPKGIIQPAKMQVVLFDILRADDFVFDFVKKDSAKKPEEELAKLQRQIFAEHKITKEEFYKSFDFYKAHPDIMQVVLDSMINISTRNKYEDTRGKLKLPKDSLKVN